MICRDNKVVGWFTVVVRQSLRQHQIYSSKMFVKEIIFVVASMVALSTQEPVLVSVYYESLCPDSIRFIRNQLYPTWQALGETYIVVDFLPYGKATHVQDADGVWSYTCQHGPDECVGNRAQACALDTFEGNQTTSVNYVYCVMTNAYPPTAGPACVAEIPAEYAPVQTCIDGELGDTLIVAYGERTHAFTPPITFVPTIAFDNEYTVEDQAAALVDLLAVVCSKLTGTLPTVCAGKRVRYQ